MIKKNRIEFLSKYLNSQLAVKYDDFVDYPKKINERILLFTKLKNIIIYQKILETQNIIKILWHQKMN